MVMAQMEHEEKKERTTVAQFLRRRRSLSPTYIELMRPVSELIRPTRARSTVEAEGEAIERRSPTPERTRPRSPSPVYTERSSRSFSRFERSGRFDIMSRYEATGASLKSARKYQVVTQIPFSLDHAPRVTVRMRCHRVPCGQDTRFTLNVQAKPEAEIRWYHNRQEIQEGSKYQITNISGVLSLKIIECTAEDSGTYRVVCTNSKGETSDYATLDVSGGEFSTYSSRRKDEEVPAIFFPDVTKTDYYHTSAYCSPRSHLDIKETSTKFVIRREVPALEYAAVERLASSPIKYGSTEYLCSPSYSLSETLSAMKTKTNVGEEVKKVSPARILTKPQSTTASLGETARFSSDIDGEPAPIVHEGVKSPTPIKSPVASPPQVTSPITVKSPEPIASPTRTRSPVPSASPP